MHGWVEEGTFRFGILNLEARLFYSRSVALESNGILPTYFRNIHDVV